MTEFTMEQRLRFTAGVQYAASLAAQESKERKTPIDFVVFYEDLTYSGTVDYSKAKEAAHVR